VEKADFGFVFSNLVDGGLIDACCGGYVSGGLPRIRLEMST